MTANVEFSRIVRVDTLPRDGLEQKIAANDAERAALAERFGLVAVESLEAELVVTRSGRGARVVGKARAKVMQTCVVTLEPFAAEVIEDIDVRFAPDSPEQKREPIHEHEIRFEDEDEPDPLIDGRIDLGELAAEFIALGLDPHPRKPGVEFEEPKLDDEEEASPFALLARLSGSDDAE